MDRLIGRHIGKMYATPIQLLESLGTSAKYICKYTTHIKTHKTLNVKLTHFKQHMKRIHTTTFTSHMSTIMVNGIIQAAIPSVNTSEASLN